MSLLETACSHCGKSMVFSPIDYINTEANLAFLPFPVGAGEDDATVLSSCNWTYIVNKDSKNLDLAKDYCEYILTSE